MNQSERFKLQTLIDNQMSILINEMSMQGHSIGYLGESIQTLMANAVMTVLEAVEDTNKYFEDNYDLDDQ